IELLPHRPQGLLWLMAGFELYDRLLTADDKQIPATWAAEILAALQERRAALNLSDPWPSDPVAATLYGVDNPAGIFRSMITSVWRVATGANWTTSALYALIATELGLTSAQVQTYIGASGSGYRATHHYWYIMRVGLPLL